MGQTKVASGRNKYGQLKSFFGWRAKGDTAGGTIFRNMAVLASGAIAARVVGVATIPIITRIYTPDHFGALSVFVSMMALILPFGTLRYSTAIPLPKNDGTAANIFALCLVSLVFVATLASILLWNSAPYLLTLFSMEELLPYWWLVIVALVGGSSYEILSSWAVRERAFVPLAKVSVWQSVVSALLKIGLGFIGLKPIGLLIGQVASYAVGCGVLSKKFYFKLSIVRKHVTARRIVFVFKRYADLPKFRLPSQFLLAFSVNAPLLFFAMIFGKQVAGQLGLALMVLALPISLFGNTTGQAYYAEISKIGRKHPEKIYRVTKHTIKRLAFFGVAPFLILLLAGQWIFIFMFGEVWRDAGIFASSLAFYLLAQFVSSPLINVLNVFDKQSLFLKMNLIRSLFLVVVFGFVYIFGIEAETTVTIYGLVMAGYYLIVSIAIFKIIKLN